MFADYQCLMKIWTHPWAVKLEAIRRLEREHLDDMREFLNDSESESESSEDDGERHEDKWRSSNSESGSHCLIYALLVGTGTILLRGGGGGCVEVKAKLISLALVKISDILQCAV